jgi:hypothetical protein
MNKNQIMKKTFTKVLVVMVLIAIASAYSCKNRGESKSKTEINAIEGQVLEQKIEENVYPLPTSAEVIKKLSDLDLGYILGASNPPASARNYVSSYARAVNLGVFGADLSYATLYNMQQDVIDYMQSMRTMANDLNLSKIYDESLYDEIKANFDSRDTLVTILTGAFDRTYSYMVDAGQANLALLMVGGAWIEGMHLTLSVSESGAHLTGFEQVLVDQKKSFEMYEEIAKPYAEDALVAKFLAGLQPVKDKYATLTTSLTMQDIEDLKKAVGEVRTALIK